ncbi:MAG: hypothetical protein KC503_26780 [Myxococcales bacterium]|nr:hypothetical protein [Myxococcales bacterium]
MRTHLRRLALLSLAVASFVLLSGFRPFTPVKDVCPTCKRPKSDVVVLVSGARIRCRVVAQNADHYVITYLGEWRSVAKTQVSSVEWKTSEASVTQSGDQVLLKNGLVFHGTITLIEKGRFVRVTMGKHNYVCFKAQVEAIYRAGKKLDNW